MGKATGKYVLFIALAVISAFQWKTLLTNQYTNIVGSEGVGQTYAWLHFWLRSRFTLLFFHSGILMLSQAGHSPAKPRPQPTIRCDFYLRSSR